MNSKSLYVIGATVGGVIGGMVPDLWHAGTFSMWGVVFSTIGGMVGIWAVYRYAIA